MGISSSGTVNPCPTPYDASGRHLAIGIDVELRTFQTSMRKLRFCLFFAGATLGLAAMATPDAQARDDAKNAEEITVTGSRIQRNDLIGSSPITQIQAEEIQFQGATRVEDMLRSYPQVYANQSAGQSNSSTGTATVNLRNLGTERTLVLVNGRRLPAGSPLLGGIAPDINQIPGALIKQVEILTGGASATYGSDAVAGVINFQLMDDFEGVLLDIQYGQYDHDNDDRRWQKIVTEAGYPTASGHESDGGISEFSLIAGLEAPDGRGNLTAYATYREINAVLQGQRDYSSCAFNDDLSSCLGSSTIPQGRFTDFGATSSPFDFIVEGDQFVARQGETYNYGPANYFQRPDERYTLGAFAHHKLGEWTEAYAEFMYMNDRSTAQIAPSGNFFHTDELNCGNAFLSDQQFEAICGSQGLTREDMQTVNIGRRNVEGGNRRQELRHASYRGVLGVRGDFADSWHFDAFAQYARVEMRSAYEKDLSITRIRRALDAVRTDPDDPNSEIVCRSALPDAQGMVEDPDCVPWNIFRTGAVTREMIHYLTKALKIRGTTEQTVASTFISGDLGARDIRSPLAESPANIALGAEYRKETLKLDPDEGFRTGDGAGQGGATHAISGSYDVASLFAEISIPLVEGEEYMQELLLDTAYRYSDYDYDETTHAYAFRLGWKVDPAIRLRGSYQRAVRGPNVQELFLPRGFSLFEMSRDPCAGPTTDGKTAQGYTFEQCALSGVTEDQWGKIEHSPAAQYNVLQGGNPDLSPEVAKTWSVGLVYTPESIDGLSLTVDYYNIQIEGGIRAPNPEEIIRQCLTGNQPLCERINRGQNGDLWVGSKLESSGHVVALRDNLPGEEVDGLDITFDYALHIGAWGKLSFNNVLSYIDSWELRELEGAPTRSCAGNWTCGPPVPDVQNRLRVTWDSPWSITTSLMWRHINRVDGDDENLVDLREMNYLDLTVIWKVSDYAEIQLGSNNLLDKSPPVAGNPAGPSRLGNGNVFPGTYDALGRHTFLGMSVEF